MRSYLDQFSDGFVFVLIFHWVLYGIWLKWFLADLQYQKNESLLIDNNNNTLYLYVKDSEHIA